MVANELEVKTEGFQLTLSSEDLDFGSGLIRCRLSSRLESLKSFHFLRHFKKDGLPHG